MRYLARVSLCVFVQRPVCLFGVLLGALWFVPCWGLAEEGSVAARTIATEGVPAPDMWLEHRRRGPQHFAELVAEAAKSDPSDTAVVSRWRAALDAIGGALDSSHSGLYWYTDWSAACAESRRTGKPILSLRLLGQLTDEYSCANSRFFRSLLYVDPRVSETLRGRFVLHWESVRPVPRVTIDFGDGRRLETTLTGNSIHYVVTADGEVIDAMPGLCGSVWFADWLDRVALTHQRLVALEPAVRSSAVRGYQERELEGIRESWVRELARIERPVEMAGVESGGRPDVSKASTVAVTKRLEVEVPLLSRLYDDLERLQRHTQVDDWDSLATYYVDECRISAASRERIASQMCGEACDWSGLERDELLEMRIEKLEQTLAYDTVFNRFGSRRKVLQLLVERGDEGRSHGIQDDLGHAELNRLNERVYADVFLTPRSDPWLGLLPVDRYSALAEDGVVLSETESGGAARIGSGDQE